MPHLPHTCPFSSTSLACHLKNVVARCVEQLCLPQVARQPGQAGRHENVLHLCVCVFVCVSVCVCVPASCVSFGTVQLARPGNIFLWACGINIINFMQLAT